MSWGWCAYLAIDQHCICKSDVEMIQKISLLIYINLQKKEFLFKERDGPKKPHKHKIKIWLLILIFLKTL